MKFKDLEGYKTYLTMVATLMYALGGLAAGFIEWNAAIALILGALGVSGLRHGMIKSNPIAEVRDHTIR